MHYQPESATPIACNLSAMNGEQRSRYQSLRRRIHESAQQIEEVPSGYDIGFGAETETLMLLAEFISLERLCCPFFDFTIKLDAGAEQSWLTVTGPEGTKELLRSEMGLEVEPDDAQI